MPVVARVKQIMSRNLMLGKFCFSCIKHIQNLIIENCYDDVSYWMYAYDVDEMTATCYRLLVEV
jgi:hypothetical protein